MKVIRFVLISLVFLIGVVLLARMFSAVEIDDVHPDIPCEDWILEKSKVYWVIPMYQNNSIASEENRNWCKDILDRGKELQLHGVYHTYEEFSYLRDEKYLQMGENAFQTCFNMVPSEFKAPQLAFNENNRRVIESHGMKIKGKWNQLFHKVYHCSDTGEFPNWLIRFF